MASDSPYVTDDNRWWQERIDALDDNVKLGVSTITHYARRTYMDDIVAGRAMITWAELADGDLAQTCADLINDVLAGCEAADVDPERVLSLAREQRK